MKKFLVMSLVIVSASAFASSELDEYMARKDAFCGKVKSFVSSELLDLARLASRIDNEEVQKTLESTRGALQFQRLQQKLCKALVEKEL